MSIGMATDDARSTPTIKANSIRNRPIDIADPTTASVDVDGNSDGDERKPVDDDSAWPERGEQFGPHRRAMPSCAAAVKRSAQVLLLAVCPVGVGVTDPYQISFSFAVLREIAAVLRSSRGEHSDGTLFTF